MHNRIAGLVLLISTLVLVGVGLAVRAGSSERRADLIGPVVAASSTPTTSAAKIPKATTTTTTRPTTVGDQDAATKPRTASVVNVPPRHLTIAAIGVDVPVVAVGQTADGSMEIPGPSNAGWYRFGPTPGSAAGSSVIAAHVDYNGAAGPFFDLRRLEVGTAVTVTDGAGKVHAYAVTERFQVAKDKLPIPDLFRTGGAPTLTLITCGGAFNASSRHYQDNIVIRAVPV